MGRMALTSKGFLIRDAYIAWTASPLFYVFVAADEERDRMMIFFFDIDANCSKRLFQIQGTVIVMKQYSRYKICHVDASEGGIDRWPGYEGFRRKQTMMTRNKINVG
jgi:hypothetical protein